MRTPPDPDETRNAQRGDRLATGELWLQHRRFVATVLLAHAGARDLDDLLQEVALRMTRSIGELEDPARLRPWLRAIARNVAIDHARRSVATPPLPLPCAPGDDAFLLEPAYDAPSQQRHQEELEQTMRDLARLDPVYREPLLLRALDGLSQREIAVALDVPETTVETRLARARRWLRERADEEERANPTEPDRQHAPTRRTVD
ncbi:MAG TPA: RNA polymerase sigma factor [Planctomycetota bacterium]|nr:RNA polymerase sigma factor [Planctomycetota bacterium]